MKKISRNLVERIASLPKDKRKAFYQSLDEDTAERILYTWRIWARPEQLPPKGDWTFWLYLAGRGSGKTRAAAEWIIEEVRGGAKKLAILGATAADVRDVQVEGPSGILACSPPDFCPHYEPSKRRLTWPNGAAATLFSAERPDRLRGPQFEKGWVDELAAHKYPAAFDHFKFGLRLGTKPQAVISTTPRPIRAIKELTADPDCVISRGSTYDNRANLAPSFYRSIISRYEGTTLGRQEIYAEILEELPGALWKRAAIDMSRAKKVPELARVVVAVDPATTSGQDSDETGIVAAAKGVDAHYYVLADYSCRLSPARWAKNVVSAYYRHKADRIVAETNNGGDLVETVIRTVDGEVSYKKIAASRGKVTRAEPVSSLYEQGRVHHAGIFRDLEDQMCNFFPEGGPKADDRVDALVWAITELKEKERPKVRAKSLGRR